MSEEHVPERIFIQRVAPYLDTRTYLELQEDRNIPPYLRKRLWGPTSHLNAHAFLDKEMFTRLKAQQRVILLLDLMSHPPREASRLVVQYKQVDYYNTLLLTRSINGWERASLIQQTPVMPKKEEKKGFFEKLFGW